MEESRTSRRDFLQITRGAFLALASGPALTEMAAEAPVQSESVRLTINGCDFPATPDKLLPALEALEG